MSGAINDYNDCVHFIGTIIQRLLQDILPERSLKSDGTMISWSQPSAFTLFHLHVTERLLYFRTFFNIHTKGFFCPQNSLYKIVCHAALNADFCHGIAFQEVCLHFNCVVELVSSSDMRQVRSVIQSLHLKTLHTVLVLPNRRSQQSISNSQPGDSFCHLHSSARP